MRNIFGDHGNKERNFWEQGNSVKVNFGEHLNLFLRNKGTTVNFHREQENMHPPPREALIFTMVRSCGHSLLSVASVLLKTINNIIGVEKSIKVDRSNDSLLSIGFVR